MAGRGPAPKDPSKRARRNGDPVPLKVVVAELGAAQPGLPAARPGGDAWPEQTVEFWRMWQESPLSADFTESDWSFLLDTAVLHAEFWSGESRVAAELRQRVAKFGATPEDRARLRITFAAADVAEDKPASKKASARNLYGGLKSTGGGSDAVAGA